MPSQTHRPIQPINLKQKLALVTEQWSPRVIAEMNDYQFKVVRLQGDFVWHSHLETDEAFLVLDGQLRIDFRDGHVTLQTGELFVVPKGVEHKPYAEHEVQVMLIEPRGVLNTGHEGVSAQPRTMFGYDVYRYWGFMSLDAKPHSQRPLPQPCRDSAMGVDHVDEPLSWLMVFRYEHIRRWRFAGKPHGV